MNFNFFKNCNLIVKKVTGKMCRNFEEDFKKFRILLRENKLHAFEKFSKIVVNFK